MDANHHKRTPLMRAEHVCLCVDVCFIRIEINLNSDNMNVLNSNENNIFYLNVYITVRSPPVRGSDRKCWRHKLTTKAHNFIRSRNSYLLVSLPSVRFKSMHECDTTKLKWKPQTLENQKEWKGKTPKAANEIPIAKWSMPFSKYVRMSDSWKSKRVSHAKPSRNITSTHTYSCEVREKAKMMFCGELSFIPLLLPLCFF